MIKSTSDPYCHTSYYGRIYSDFFKDDAHFKLPIDTQTSEKVKHFWINCICSPVQKIS